MEESCVKESVLINVFEMFIKRLDELQDSVNRMNNYLINEARFKTNDVISGSVFNYPFEIHNYKFDKKMYAYVYIKLLNKEGAVSLYDLWWNIWDPNHVPIIFLTDKDKVQQKELNDFMLFHFGTDKYNKIKEGIQIYLNDKKSEGDEDKFISCLYYDIDTLYEYLPEYVLNAYITINEKIQNFKSFNHLNYCIGINYVNDQAIYIDELIESVLTSLKKFGYKSNDIQCIKVFGLDNNLQKLLSFYDMSMSCNDIKKRRFLVQEYVNNLCYCTRDKIRDSILDFLVSKNTELPFFDDIDEVAYILDILKIPDLEELDDDIEDLNEENPEENF